MEGYVAAVLNCVLPLFMTYHSIGGLHGWAWIVRFFHTYLKKFRPCLTMSSSAQFGLEGMGTQFRVYKRYRDFNMSVPISDRPLLHCCLFNDSRRERTSICTIKLLHTFVHSIRRLLSFSPNPNGLTSSNAFVTTERIFPLDLTCVSSGKRSRIGRYTRKLEFISGI